MVQKDHLSYHTFCWWLKRRDGVVMGFTEHDRDLIMDGVCYHASGGMMSTALMCKENLSIDHMDIEGILQHDMISEVDIVSGKYAYAELRIYQVDFAHLPYVKKLIKRGWMGEITLKDHRFIATLEGLTNRLHQEIGEHYSASCRAEFGDHHCKKDRAAYCYQGSIEHVYDTHSFYDSQTAYDDDYFSHGVLTWLSGKHQGTCSEIHSYRQGVFEIRYPLYYPMEKGDRYEVVAGCDKRKQTCALRFQNVINFRGEPHIPGPKNMLTK